MTVRRRGDRRPRRGHGRASPVILGLAVLVPLGKARGQEPPAPLTLSEAISLALDHHPAVGQAEALHAAAASAVRQARGALYPALSVEGNLTRFQEPMVVAPLHGFDPTAPPTFDRSLAQGYLSAGYLLWDGGARAARIHQAEAGEGMAGAGREGAQMEVAAQVSAAYLEVLSQRDLLEAAESQRTALEGELSRVEQFLGQGKAARVDLLRVQAALSRAEASEISVRSNLEVARGRLARLTGLDEREVSARGLGRVRLRIPEPPSQGEALAAAREANPDLAAARQRLAGASAGAREAEAAWFPRLQAGGRYTDYGTLSGGHSQEWQASLRVSYPLFTGGARVGEQERARAEARQASEGLRLAELSLEDDVERAEASVSESRARREALEQAVAQAEEVTRIEALSLEAGAGVQTDYLQAQAELFQTRASLAQARHGEVLARIQLARVMGELTLTWIDENTEVER